MAKDDYFVLVYRLLRYLYGCLKAGERSDISAITSEALNINNGYWMYILESMCDEGYIKGIYFSTSGKFKVAKIYDLKITEKGIDFLQNSKQMENAAYTLNAVEKVIPGF